MASIELKPLPLARHQPPSRRTAVLRRALLALATLLAAVQGASAACHLDQVNTLPITFAKGGHLLVDVAFNGHPATMVVDTGMWRTLLSAEAAQRSEVAVSPTHDFYALGIGGRRHWDVGAARRIDIGTLHVPNAELAISEPRPAETQPEADGLLGADLLFRFDLDVDIVGRRITMFEAESGCTEPVSAMDPPFYSVALLPVKKNDSRPRFMVSLNGQDFIGLLDTGAGGSFIYKHAADRLGLGAEPAKTGIVHGIGPDAVQVSHRVLKSIGIGDLEIDNLPVYVLDEDSEDRKVDMLVGWDIIRRVHFWISRSSGTLIMQSPPTASHGPTAAAH